MKKIFLAAYALIFSAAFASAVFAAGTVTYTAKPEIRLMYPQAGFWEAEVLIEGSDKRMEATSSELKELMKQSPKASEYMEAFNGKHTIAHIGIYGGLLPFFGGAYFFGNNQRRGNSAYSLWSIVNNYACNGNRRACVSDYC
jgi:hypothetical protein